MSILRDMDTFGVAVLINTGKPKNCDNPKYLTDNHLDESRYHYI